MRRREFITFVGGTLVATAGMVRAQPARKMPTVGHL
jgi:hypothetical protein